MHTHTHIQIHTNTYTHTYIHAKVHGNTQYGSDYHSASYFVEAHEFNSAQQDADHMHEVGIYT